MIVRRIAAQLVDLLIGILVMFVTFAYLLPLLGAYMGSDGLLVAIGMVFIVLAVYLLHYPFMVNGQTLGKAFFGLKIVSTDAVRRDVPVAVIVQREIFCKLLSCYFICLPMAAGKCGGQDEATHTAVRAIREKKRSAGDA